MATIVCSAEKVKVAARAAIESIMQKRIEHDEARIAARMETKYLGREGFCYPSREEAIMMLDNSG